MKVERKGKYVCKTVLNHDAGYMVLEVGDMVRTSWKRPGQFVHVKCGDGRLLRRPISVCSCMEDEPEDTVAIVFERRGTGTDWLAQRECGEYLDVLGFLGNGFTMGPEGRYLLVGGGIGVPPLLGCAKAAPNRCTAVLGFRSADRAMLLDDFRAVCPEVVVMSDDGTLGEHGFVDAGVRRLLEAGERFDGVLACGPKPMLRSVAKAAAEFGVPCQVSMEERMACGVGACLGCACKTKDKNGDPQISRVCLNGPVFDAKEVDWT